MLFCFTVPQIRKAVVSDPVKRIKTDPPLPVALDLSSRPIRQSRACLRVAEIKSSDI